LFGIVVSEDFLNWVGFITFYTGSKLLITLIWQFKGLFCGVLVGYTEVIYVHLCNLKANFRICVHKYIKIWFNRFDYTLNKEWIMNKLDLMRSKAVMKHEYCGV